DYACVECTNDFQCTMPAAPKCDATNNCIAPANECTSDDMRDTVTNDDGPAGANDITPATVGTTTLINDGRICTAPSSEAAWFKFTVTDHQNVDISLDWTNAATDLDIVVFDSQQHLVGVTYWTKPSVINLSYLPAGTYFVDVTQFTPAATMATEPYTLSLTT